MIGPCCLAERGQDVRNLLLLRRMQPIPALHCERIAAQLGVAGHAPDIGVNAVFLGQNLLRAKNLVQDGSAAEQLRGRLAMPPASACRCRAECLRAEPSGMAGIA